MEQVDGDQAHRSLRRIEGVEIKHVTDQSKEAIQKLLRDLTSLYQDEETTAIVNWPK